MSNSSTREKILRAAKALILSRGFSATTVDLICEHAAVSKGSFYHFFQSKENLGIEVLQWSLERTGEVLIDGEFLSIEDPVESSLGYLEHVANNAELLWGAGCLLGTFANELADTNPRLQAQVARIFTLVAEDVAGRLEPVSVRLGGNPDGRELADQFLVILEGSVTLAKAYRDPSRINKAILGFRNSLAALLLAPTP